MVSAAISLSSTMAKPTMTAFQMEKNLHGAQQRLILIMTINGVTAVNRSTEDLTTIILYIKE